MRPQITWLPSGVYRIAEGMEKLVVESEYRLLQSISIVPGMVMRVFTCKRLRSVIFELPLGGGLLRVNSAARHGKPDSGIEIRSARRREARGTSLVDTTGRYGMLIRRVALPDDLRHHAPALR